MRKFEFQCHPGDGTMNTTEHEFEEIAAAKAHAGRMAKRIAGPVDVALVGAGPWESRYITTASPSEVHATGYRLERLDS